MIGHEGIVSMRRRGIVPGTVVVVFDPGLMRMDWHEVDPRIAYVAWESKDNPSRVDLRCFVGLPIVVIGDVGDPVKPAVAALVKAGAKSITAAVLERDGADAFRMLEMWEGGAWHAC
jgi:hypothetical protein